MAKNWKLRSSAKNEKAAATDLSVLSKQFEISEFLAGLLWQRGYSTEDELALFLQPALQKLGVLELWPGVLEGAELLTQALLQGKKLAVWGDYDVDGITASALVIDVLRHHNFDAVSYIPNRLEERYGVTVFGVEKLAAQGVAILVTVDCGSTDHAAIERARELGMTVIITDHHLCEDTVPAAHVIINPHLSPCPCPHLAGVGVAFFLMAAVNNALGEAGKERMDMRSCLDLVALGTLADVMYLSSQNRILVKNGLLKIAEGQRPGIAALKQVCKYAPKASLGAGQLVFTLAPRINAAGRMGQAEVALQLLLAQDRATAAELAAKLDAMNSARRAEEDSIFEAANKQAEEQAAAGRVALVLYGEQWHQGIIGIVASRIVEQWGRPTVVLSTDIGASAVGEDIIKGSARTAGTFNLHQALSQCRDLFIHFGGHRAAAGMSLSAKNKEAFSQRFDAEVRAIVGDSPAPAELSIDGELDFSYASDFTILKELEFMQPFGMGNPEPTFSSPPLRIKNIHKRPFFLQLELVDEQHSITLHGKIWQRTEAVPLSMKGQRIRIAYTPRIDRYNGIANVDLRIKDWQKVEE